jgi:acetyl-CoA carboxylase carboxyl transferase subunit alpha
MREAAEALRLTAQDLLKLGVCDRVIAEPMGGAQRDPQATVAAVGDAIAAMLAEIGRPARDKLIKARRRKYLDMGSKGLAA